MKNACIPFCIEDDRLNDLLAYFLYCAPEIESVHTRTIPRDKHEQILSSMMESRNFTKQVFCASNVVIQKELSKISLDGNDICVKCKRFVCKCASPKKEIRETNLQCLLRHIRNAIAHGRVYYKKCKNYHYVIFEDVNRSNNITARIVCNKSDLTFWKKVLGHNRKNQ